MKFGAAGFIVPFFFVYYPALLFQGTWTEIGLAVLTGGVGVVALAAGLEGYFIRGAAWLERGLFLAAALLSDRSRPRHRPRSAAACSARRRADDATLAPRRRPGGPPVPVSPAAKAALTLIAAALILGTFAYGILRLYA